MAWVILMDGSNLTGGKERDDDTKMCHMLRGYDVVQDRILLKEFGVSNL
jgi:hypothetical protein